MESSSVYYKNISTTVDQGVVEVNTTISPGKITRFLLTVIGILFVLSLLGQIAVNFLPDFPTRDLFKQMFDVNREQNFPTLYSSLALLFSSILFAMIGIVKTQNQDYYRWYWKGLSFIFLYLSLDELLSFHERFNKPISNSGVFHFIYFTWVIPAFFAVVMFLFIFYKFFLHLPRYMKRSFLIALFLFLTGIFLIETVSGYYMHGNLLKKQTIIYSLMTIVEESFEMLGVVVLIHALITYITQLGINQIKFNFNLVKKPELASMKSNKL